MQVDPNQRSYTCAFCESTYVVELPADAQRRQRPEFVIGFAVTAFALVLGYRVYTTVGMVDLDQLREEDANWPLQAQPESHTGASRGEP